MGHARALMGLDPTLIEATARKVVADALSVRQTEKLVYDILHPAPKAEKKSIVDPNVKDAERELERSLGVRARIYDRKGREKLCWSTSSRRLRPDTGSVGQVISQLFPDYFLLTTGY